jgi:hypothetical protein
MHCPDLFSSVRVDIFLDVAQGRDGTLLKAGNLHILLHLLPRNLGRGKQKATKFAWDISSGASHEFGVDFSGGGRKNIKDGIVQHTRISFREFGAEETADDGMSGWRRRKEQHPSRRSGVDSCGPVPTSDTIIAKGEA